jgi:hypothetical protein
MTSEEWAAKLLEIEYEGLKAEQRGRIGQRDNFLWTALGGYVAVAAGVATTHSFYLLLAAPIVGLVVGWTYLANDIKVSSIKAYVRTGLTSQAMLLTDTLRAKEGLPAGNRAPFGWERVGSPRRNSYKRFQLLAELAAFVVPALVALLVLGRQAPPGPHLLVAALAAVETLALVVLVREFVRFNLRVVRKKI